MTEKITIAQYKAMEKGKGSARARTTPPKKEKKVTGGKAQMDISEEETEEALSAVRINRKASFVEYDKDMILFILNGKEFKVTVTRV